MGPHNSNLLLTTAPRSHVCCQSTGTLTRTLDASRKRASPPQEGLTSRKRQASPPGSPECSTYACTFTGDTDYNPQPQRDIQVIPRDTWVPNPLLLDPLEIFVLPATHRIIDYELQTAAFRAQTAGDGPDPDEARPVRPPIPQYICESDCGVKLATCWLRKRKGKTG